MILCSWVSWPTVLETICLVKQLTWRYEYNMVYAMSWASDKCWIGNKPVPRTFRNKNRPIKHNHLEHKNGKAICRPRFAIFRNFTISRPGIWCFILFFFADRYISLSIYLIYLSIYLYIYVSYECKTLCICVYNQLNPPTLWESNQAIETLRLLRWSFPFKCPFTSKISLPALFDYRKVCIYIYIIYIIYICYI
jgi:hypothetical protein